MILSYDACNISYVSIMSPLSRHNFNVARLSICERSWLAYFSEDGILVALIWICSSAFIACGKENKHTWGEISL